MSRLVKNNYTSVLLDPSAIQRWPPTHRWTWEMGGLPELVHYSLINLKGLPNDIYPLLSAPHREGCS